MTRAANQRWGEVVAETLASQGVRTVVVAPGSRSTPLVVAVHRHPALETVVHLDERSAAFFALGTAKATGRPAAVLTTSGTAAANLLPAAVEADASETPLLLLTADRPPRLRGSDANQTIDQIELFGRRARWFRDLPEPSADPGRLRHLAHLVTRAVALSLSPVPGPVHLNAPFSKPLTPGPGSPAPEAEDLPTAAAPTVSGAEQALTGPDLARLVEAFTRAERGLVVAGPARAPARDGPAVLGIGAWTGYPVLADPLSGARYSGADTAENAVVVGTYDLTLAASHGLRPDHIVRFGSSPTSARLLAYLEDHADVPQTVIGPAGRRRDHLNTASAHVRCSPAWLADALGPLSRPDRSGDWPDRWRALEGAAREALDASVPGEIFEGRLARDVVAAVGDGGMVVVSNSMPVRDLDAFVPHSPARVNVLGNRGASGIDGMVSTALGAAWTRPGRHNVALLGDLALLHDVNGLLTAREGIDLVIVVLHNDGGGIFHMLPVRELEPEFTRYFATPHGRDFRHAAALYDIPYRQVAGNGLEAAVREALGRGGVEILEVRVDREANHRRRAEVIADAQRRLMDWNGGKNGG